MKIPPFDASIKEIKYINKTNGQTIVYLFVERPVIKNEVDAEIEPQKVFSIIAYPGKQYMLRKLKVGDIVSVSVWINSKPYVTRRGWENYSLSMHLSNIKKTEA